MSTVNSVVGGATRQRVFLIGLISLYLIALHCSMAAMEIFIALIYLGALWLQVTQRDFKLWRTNRVLLLSLLALLLAVVFSLLATPQEKPFLFQFGFMRWVFGLWALSIVLNDLWSVQFERYLISLWSVLVIICGIYGLLQCLTGIDFLRTDAVVPLGKGIYRATGFFSMSMTYAYSLGLSFFAIVLPALRRGRIPFTALVVFGSLGIISSMARGAWVAWLVCVLVYFAVNHRRLMLPALAGIVVLVTGFGFYSTDFARRLGSLTTLNLDHSGSVRMALWRSYWEMFLDHPVFGVGLLEGDKLLPAYYERLGLAPSYPSATGAPEIFVSHAHNNLLQWLAGAGLFGFACYILVSAIFLHQAWQIRKMSPWGWSLLLSQIFLHVGGMTEANFINASVNHMLIFVWSVVLVVNLKRSSNCLN